MTPDYLKSVGQDLTEDNYFPIVGDICYRYSREAKERFFEDEGCCFLFLKSMSYLQDQAKKEVKKNPNIKEILLGLKEEASANIDLK